MKYIEIEDQLSEYRKTYQDITKQAREVSAKLTDLSKLKSEKEAELLIEFLGLNSTIQINRWINFNGIQTNIKKTPTVNGNSNNWSCSFREGDVIKIIKINKKSVVIECINKKIIKRVDGVSTETNINPQSQFRVESESFRSSILLDSSYYNAFTTWIKRKESLEQLLES